MLPASRAARAGVHRDADIGLGERGGVVGAVAAHRHQLAALLFLADQRELVLGRRLGEEVVDAGLGRDRRCGQRVVAGDHHRADAHLAQFAEAFADAGLDDVLQRDRAEQTTVPGHRERGHAGPAISSVDRRSSAAAGPSPRAGIGAEHRIDRALADRRSVAIDARDAGLGGEGNDRGILGQAAGRTPNFSRASTTIERPSGVSSARLASDAASASSAIDMPVTGGTRSPGGRRW
jgi:hypothetical protein